MKDRRDFMRLFGVGAIVAPIIGASADESKAARLIEVPNVRPVELFARVPKEVDISGTTRATLILEDANGAIHKFSGPAHFPNGVIGPEVTDISISFNSWSSSPMLTFASMGMSIRGRA